MPTSSLIASTWKASSRYSLLRKAFTLVAIPLVFEILFVGTLAQLHSHTRGEIARMDHRRLVSDTTNALLLDLFEIGILTKSDSPSVDELKMMLERLTKKVGRLSELVVDNSEQTKIVAGSRTGLRRLELLLNAYGQGKSASVGSQVWMGDHFENFSEARRTTLFQMATPELMAMAKETRLQEMDSIHERDLANSRWFVKLILVVGLLLSAAISMISVWMISRNLTNRLKIMTDNAWRLASSKPLNPVIAGNDEIAYLDLVFHNMQDALNESNHREQALIDNAVDVICSLDSADNFTRVSPAAIKMLGYLPEELLGTNCLSIVAEDERLATTQMLALIKSEPVPVTFESKMRSKNGALIDVLWSAQRSESEQSYTSIIHDISEERDAERMKQEVIKMVTHDLKTPLTTIRIFLEMLQLGAVGNLSQSGVELVGSADRSAERMLSLINDLLDIEKIKAGMMKMELVSVSLSQLFTEASESVAALAAQRQIRIEVDASDLRWVIDPNLITRVLINLISNAIKFSTSPGSITVSAQVSSQQLQISVTDQGRGIPADMLQSIFDPFQQTRHSDAKQKGGSGLGLAICKALVELHGGTIEVHSEEKKGSTFLFTLPSIAAPDKGV